MAGQHQRATRDVAILQPDGEFNGENHQQPGTGLDQVDPDQFFFQGVSISVGDHRRIQVVERGITGKIPAIGRVDQGVAVVFPE